MILHFILTWSLFQFLNKSEVDTTQIDTLLNQDSESKEQILKDNEKTDLSNSSSTNKELYDDIQDIPIQDNFLVLNTPAEDAAETIERLNEYAKKFSETYELGDSVSSIADKNMWDKLYTHISSNLSNFLIDGSLSIQLHMRYVMCSYIIAFIPAQFAIVIPGFYTYLIPKQAYTVPILKDALKGLKRFLKFSKTTSKDKLFIVFYFGRTNSIAEDIEFIKNIPEMLRTNPMGILREFLDFQIKAEGYDPSKY